MLAWGCVDGGCARQKEQCLQRPRGGGNLAWFENCGPWLSTAGRKRMREGVVGSAHSGASLRGPVLHPAEGRPVLAAAGTHARV